MNNNEEYKIQLCNMLQRYRWQWFVTLNVDDTDLLMVERRLKMWRKFIRDKSYDLGYFGLYNFHRNSHIHLLMVLRSKDENSSIDHDIEDFSKYWTKISTRTCLIERIYNIDGICEYLSLQNTPFDEDHKKFEFIQPIGTTSILKRYMI